MSFYSPWDHFDNQILGNIAFIKGNNRTVCYEKLFQAEVIHFKDIFSGNNRPLTFKLLCEK